MNEANKNYCTFDIYQGDIKNMNMLHYAILNKDKAMIQLKALQETIKDNKEYDESYGHLKSLFDN